MSRDIVSGINDHSRAVRREGPRFRRAQPPAGWPASRLLCIADNSLAEELLRFCKKYDTLRNQRAVSANRAYVTRSGGKRVEKKRERLQGITSIDRTNFSSLV